MTEKKPERTRELHVDIDTPIEAAWKAVTDGPGIANWFAPIAEVAAPGEGATVKAGWSDEMMMTSTVVAWEPLKHVRWLDESGWMGPGTSLALDYYLPAWVVPFQRPSDRLIDLVTGAQGPSGRARVPDDGYLDPACP